MRRRILIGLLFLQLGLIITGCWDRKELDNISFVVAIGIDKSEHKEEGFRTTFQLVNAGEVAQGGGDRGDGSLTPVSSYSVTGVSIFESIRKAVQIIPRRIFWGHNQVLIIGEEMARENIVDLLDLFERDHEIRTDFYVLIMREGRAIDALQTMTALEKIPGHKIRKQLESTEQVYGTSYGVEILDFIRALSSEGREPVASSIKLVGDKEAGKGKKNVENVNLLSKLELDAIAAFKDGKLVGFLTPNQSRGFSWTQGKVKNTVLNISCKKEGYIVMEIIRSAVDMKARVHRGSPEISIKVR